MDIHKDEAASESNAKRRYVPQMPQLEPERPQRPVKPATIAFAETLKKRLLARFEREEAYSRVLEDNRVALNDLRVSVNQR